MNVLSLPVSSWSNEVKERMNTVVTEAAVTLNPGLFRQNVIVLLLKIPKNLLKAIIKEKDWLDGMLVFGLLCA